MTLYVTEGIVLKALPFQDYDRILTVFTKDLGLIKIFSRVRRGTPLEAIIANPFVHAEFVLNQGKKDFFYLKESSILNQNLELRFSENLLNYAAKYVQAILSSQWLQKPAHDLFHLFRLFLEALPKSSFPETLLSTLYLKILKHEGVLETTPVCSFCEQPLDAYFRSGGEIFCRTHKPPHSENFSVEEERCLVALSECRSLSGLSFYLPEEFLNKIYNIFSQVFDRT